jgi:hypothetical protein
MWYVESPKANHECDATNSTVSVHTLGGLRQRPRLAKVEPSCQKKDTDDSGTTNTRCSAKPTSRIFSMAKPNEWRNKSKLTHPTKLCNREIQNNDAEYQPRGDRRHLEPELDLFKNMFGYESSESNENNMCCKNHEVWYQQMRSTKHMMKNVTNSCSFKTTINKLQNWMDAATKNNQTGTNQKLNVMTPASEVNEHQDITTNTNKQVL